MKNVKKLVLATAALAITTVSGSALSADRTDMHGTDHRWMQFNFIYHYNELPQTSNGGDQHNYLETEFGGRSGPVDYYGFFDVFNLTNQKSSSGDKNPGDKKSRMFAKLAPRLSIDALTGKDLSFGPVKELYFATVFKWDGLIGESKSTFAGGGLFDSFWGLGADVNVPWLGKTSMNLYGYYDLNAKDWNGYQFSLNWFKPFYFFKNKSFMSFQGYGDYQFGGKTSYTGTPFALPSSNGGAIFLGLYWHSTHYAVGYGLKLYNDVYLLKDGTGSGNPKTTGVSQTLDVTYVL